MGGGSDPRQLRSAIFLWFFFKTRYVLKRKLYTNFIFFKWCNPPLWPWYLVSVLVFSFRCIWIFQGTFLNFFKNLFFLLYFFYLKKFFFFIFFFLNQKNRFCSEKGWGGGGVMVKALAEFPPRMQVVFLRAPLLIHILCYAPIIKWN